MLAIKWGAPLTIISSYNHKPLFIWRPLLKSPTRGLYCTMITLLCSNRTIAYRIVIPRISTILYIMIKVLLN